MAPPRRDEKEKQTKPKLPAGNASPASSDPRQDTTAELQRMLTKALQPLLEQVTALHYKFDAQQAQLMETTKKADKTEQELKELQMEWASYVPRFQGVLEEKGENPKHIMCDFLALIADVKSDVLQSEMDTIFRSYSEFIRKNDLPGEVMVRFSRRQLRDQILKATTGTTLKIKDKEIKVLKDIPFEIRRKGRKFRDLALLLQKNNIVYILIVPEGIIFMDKKEKIDSVEKAREFLPLHSRPAGEEEEEKDNSTKESEEEGAVASSNEDSDSAMGAAAPRTKYQLRKKKDKK